MQCQKCKTEFVPKSPHARNVKFCSQLCRNRTYYDKRDGAEYQRQRKQIREENDGVPRIQCQICLRRFVQIGSHVVAVHGYKTAREYREDFGYDVKRGQVPEWYRELKEEQCKDNGTVNNLKNGKKYWFKKGQEGVGVYPRSPQTMARLKKLAC